MVMTCEHVWREISTYVDGEVDAASRAAMEEHIRECSRCRSVLEGTRNVVRLYSDERMLEVPLGFSRRLEKRLARSARPEPRWLWWTAWAVPVAAVLLIAGVVTYTNVGGRDHAVKTPHAQPGKNVPPQLQVVLEPGARLFHLPGCDVIRDKQDLQKMTAKDAIAQGYTPCPRCLRKYLSIVLIPHPRGLDLDADGAPPALHPVSLP